MSKFMKIKLVNHAILFFFVPFLIQAQVSPVVNSWLYNTTKTGSYYAKGNSTTIPNNILVNCQEVSYSSNWVYIKTKGIPSYPTGPFLDGNPSQSSNQNRIIKLPLKPVKNSGTPTGTRPGNIGMFINGVALFDYRDGVAWNPNTSSLCGGPGNPPCPGGMGVEMDWNRDAVVAERSGFDCSKGHPAMGNYHHHQNPSTFKLDIKNVSTICNLYDADGLYSLDSTKHSPLIGFAYDGFPIYGAYGYKNLDGKGDIVRMKSSYRLRNISTRTMSPTGTSVPAGPNVSNTYPLGYFKEDYEYIAHPNQTDYLDEHNGRFCVTPEYPNGIYAYFATVDEKWNSTYPYVVGPTYYGNVTGTTVSAINEAVTIYQFTTGINDQNEAEFDLKVFPNPSSNIVVIMVQGLVKTDVQLQLVDMQGKLVQATEILAGQTMGYFDIQTLYNGVYFIKATSGTNSTQYKINVVR